MTAPVIIVAELESGQRITEEDIQDRLGTPGSLNSVFLPILNCSAGTATWQELTSDFAVTNQD
jgi:hypothetical protein